LRRGSTSGGGAADEAGSPCRGVGALLAVLGHTTFLTSYQSTAGQSALLPEARDELHALLNIYMLARAVYELGYELHHRPDWVEIPLQGILQLVGHTSPP
jgi:predicted trehalose synthase